MIDMSATLLPPLIAPMIGMRIDSTSDVTIAVKAPPMMIPTAISITLPLA